LETPTGDEAVLGAEADAGGARSGAEGDGEAAARSAHDGWRQAASTVDPDPRRRRGDVVVVHVHHVHLAAPASHQPAHVLAARRQISIY